MPQLFKNISKYRIAAFANPSVSGKPQWDRIPILPINIFECFNFECSKKCGTMKIIAHEAVETEIYQNICDGSDDDTATMDVPVSGNEETTDQYNIESVIPISINSLFCGLNLRIFHLLFFFFRGFRLENHHLVVGRCTTIGTATKRCKSMENTLRNASTA